MTAVLTADVQEVGSGTPAAAPRRSSAPAWWYLGVGFLIVPAFAFSPVWLRVPLALIVFVGGLAALHYGIRRNAQPGSRGPWRALFWAAGFFVSGSFIRSTVPGADASPPGPMVLLPDAFAVTAYVLTGLAFIGMLRRRRAADEAQVDALLVGATVAFMLWTFLIEPVIVRNNGSVLQTASAFFPVIDAVLVILVVQLLLAGGAHQPALWLLIVGAGTLFVGDLLFTMRDAQLADIPMHALDTMFMMAFMLIGGSALHSSMRTLTERQQVVAEDLSKVRTSVIALLIVVPVVITNVRPAVTLISGVVRTCLCVLLIIAVLARVVRSNNSRAHAEQVTRRRATHDALTELPNRELLSETITCWGARAETGEQEISLLFIDLDRFKMVNDHWGHKVGDELLCEVAGRLSAQTRAEDLVCRIGGDEFVIALASPSHSRLAESLATRVLKEFERPFTLSVGNVIVSASIGLAKAAAGAEALELIRDADTAMYKAKGSGRNAYALFDTSLRDRVRERVNLEQALRGALGNGELSVHFQPIVDLRNDELDGFEALMRWNHPVLGSVSPVDFIPIAEETGLIVESGAWLLRCSARQLAAWTAERPAGARQLHVSINISVRQLKDFALIEIVRDVLAETGLPPECLWLEITESGVMEDVETALAALGGLRELGVVLCIDDFGTGYSSLSYLHRLPVGILKIDQSFVAGVGADGPNEPIVRAVLAMTHAMGHRVVAEGVETAVQRDWLRAQGCDLAQGWLYGRPALPSNLTAAVAAPAYG